MNWKFSNDAPIYAQLIEQIKAAIVTGQFPPGERLPSVRDIAAEAGVNPNTMQRAFAELEREGLVHSQRTSGRCVTQEQAIIERTKADLAGRHIATFLSAMAALGYSGEQAAAVLNHTLEGKGDEQK